MVFIDNGKTLVSSGDKRLCFSQVDDVEPLRSFQSRGVGTLQFADDNELIYYGSGALHRLTIDTFMDKVLFTTESSGGARGASFSNDSIAINRGSTIDLWSRSSGQYTLRRSIEVQGTVGKMVFSSRIGRFLVCTSSGIFTLGSDGSGSETSFFDNRPCRAIATHGDIAAIVFDDGEIGVWNLSTRTPVRFIPSVFTLVSQPHIEFSKDGSELVCTSIPDGIKVIDVNSGEILCARSDIGQQWSATFVDDGRQILTLGDDGRVTVRDKTTLATQFAFPPLSVTGHQIAVSPSGKWLAASSLSGEIRVWDVHSDRKFATHSTSASGR